jgi:gliding motility-associated-like protein
MRNLYLLLAVVLMTLCTTTTTRAATPFKYSTTCLNDTVMFTIDQASKAGIDSVKWDYGDLASGTADSSRGKAAADGKHRFNTLGTYTVTLTAYRAGVQDVSTLSITVVTKVPYDFGPKDSTLCAGGTVTLTAPYVAGASYLWQDSSTNQSIVADTNATYKVWINGCLVPDSMNIFFSPVPTFDLGQDEVLCVGETLQLDATSQNGHYIWNTGATTPTIILHSDTAVALKPYICTVTATGCAPVSDTINITFTGSPHPFSLGPDTLLCPGESITVDGYTPGADKYRWANGATTQTTTINSSWDLWVFVNVNNTCDVLDTIRIKYTGFGPLNLGNDTTICTGNTLVITADFGTGTYLWQDGSKQAYYYVTKGGYYYVRAQVGRCMASDTIHVQFDDTLHVKLGRDTVLCAGETYTLYPNGAGRDYKWQDSSDVSTYRVTEAGIYAVVAQNTCGQAVDSVTVGYRNCDCQVFLPTAFSPNGDGVNDFFRPKYRCEIANFQLSVYNRWGQRIYYNTDPQVGWTGKKDNNPVPFGTYVWVLQYTIVSTGQTINQTGSVTVV